LTAAGEAAATTALASRAPRQAEALAALAGRGPMPRSTLGELGIAAATLKRLVAKGFVTLEKVVAGQSAASDEAAVGAADVVSGVPAVTRPDVTKPSLTEAQAAAVAAVSAAAGEFGVYLLFGVTGSGKTEVFLRLIEEQLEAGQQTLLLVPEISLTPQLVGRLEARFGATLAVLHSGLTDSERLAAWRAARSAAAKLIVGTRSAVFCPLPSPGLIIVDEEHDPSFKQHTGLRYSARDLAVVRARKLGVPVVLASATPSLETFRNARDGRYSELRLADRIGSAGTPTMHVVDMNQHASRHGLSTPLIAHLERHLGRGNQVLLFINRRGFAPVLFCPGCETVEDCPRCDAHLTIHARAAVLRCHHCGREEALRWACPRCGHERAALGEGTQRVTDELATLFPDQRIARLDRDALGSREALGDILGDVESGDTGIIVGTQLLAKGHDFPGVTLVGILNADQGLFGTDFRSEERLAQTLVQVAGRAGRRDQPGDVVIQTHFPRHPLLLSLLDHDYAAFASAALAERAAANWPPYARIALWRAEANTKSTAAAFLTRLRREALPHAAGVSVLGPTTHPLERVGGRYRYQLLFQSEQRGPLHALIDVCLDALRTWPETRRVRWALDVDPLEL
jgi:primosomal protein N' (replication factor Y)